MLSMPALCAPFGVKDRVLYPVIWSMTLYAFKPSAFFKIVVKLKAREITSRIKVIAFSKYVFARSFPLMFAPYMISL